MFTAPDYPWATEPTPINQLEVDKSYLLSVAQRPTPDPIQFYALTRTLTPEEYQVTAMAGQRENKDILAITLTRIHYNKLFLRIAHTTDTENIVLVIDKKGRGRFQQDTAEQS